VLPFSSESVSSCHKLPNLYASPNIIRGMKSRRMRCEGHVARMEVMRNEYKIKVGNLEGKSPLGRGRRRWENNIRMELRD